MSTSRRTKWHPAPPPPPSPKILHFPLSRRTRRKHTKPTAHHHNNQLLLMHQKYLSDRGKLENLFDQENNEFTTTLGPPIEWLNSNSNLKTLAVGRRERVEEQEEEVWGEYNGGGGADVFEEEKWRFQAEILRAECNFLRMEREFALKKLERNRVKMERTLRSAVQTLVSGRKKIFDGKNVNSVLEEEIEDLAEKLGELQKSSRIKDYGVRNCSNFDTKAFHLQRRLEKLGELSDESCVKELQELTESSLSINRSRHIDKESSNSNCKIKNKPTANVQVDILRKRMEGLSKGMLDGMEDAYSSIVSSTANSSVASSASTSKRIECPEFSSGNTRLKVQDSSLLVEPISHENKCSGRCKAIVRRIVDQVRAETEQWSQMQEMLGQVRGEMEELQASCDFWENRAYNSDCEIQSLRQAVEEWKQKALGYENKANELQLELSVLNEEIRKVKADSNLSQNREPLVSFGKQLEKEKLELSRHFKKNCRIDEKACKFDENALEELNIGENKQTTPTKDLPPLSLGKQLAKEKRMHRSRLKENSQPSEKCSKQVVLAYGRRKPYSNSIGIVHSPLRDISNSSPLARQNSRAAFPFHSPECSRTRDSFRK